MYRVVTKTLEVKGGQRRRLIHKGPWQPHENWARQWAEYLRTTGVYDSVDVESNGSNSNHRAEQFEH